MFMEMLGMALNNLTNKMNSKEWKPDMAQAIVYSINNCTNCEQVKDNLTEQNVSFEERNVEENEAYFEELQALGYMSLPVTVIGEYVILGNDTTWFNKALASENTNAKGMNSPKPFEKRLLWKLIRSMRYRRRPEVNKKRAFLTGIGVAAAIFLSACSSPEVENQSFPSIISMPKGSIPEGIAIKDSTAFVTSLSQGTIYQVDLKEGTSEILSSGNGDTAVGVFLDEYDRLFVAGGSNGSVQVIDVNSGEELDNYKVSNSEQTFVNDFTPLGDAIYVTDSSTPVMYKLPLGTGGALPDQDDIETIPLTGITYAEGYNANGITQTPDGNALLMIQTNTGTLFRVDAASGAATPVDVGDADLTWGDGMMREGNLLYVVRNMPNTIAVLEIDDSGTVARLQNELKDPSFDTPTAVARHGERLYLPNARFTVEDPASADFSLVNVKYGR